ncbi:hypothetical protein [Herbaspirillum sp. ST 5-3]|uniref:hypothetical protein n=1 Tax=Oxalobacteraceae TaxID=75682 RepID=UPI0010A3BB3F|nr:hypothetical protein [Herbaspirillum sp. ST 5-3]
MEAKQVEIDRVGNSFWHVNCKNHLGGVMKEVSSDENGSLIKCLHCGAKACYPVGRVGRVLADEYFDWISLNDRLPSHGQLIRARSDNGEWNERFNSNEPLGFMTEWRPLDESNGRS